MVTKVSVTCAEWHRNRIARCLDPQHDNRTPNDRPGVSWRPCLPTL